MAKKERKYIYINDLHPDGAVFQTQILDWLNLFKIHDIEFGLIQVFHIKELKRIYLLKKYLIYLKKCTELFAGAICLLPSKSVYYLANAIIIYIKIFRYLFKYHEILIFSRSLIGKEVTILRKISPAKIIFYFDARAASAEENRYIALKEHNFSLKKFRTISNVSYLEYMTLISADKVFTVSNVLRDYFQQVYNMLDKKYVYYPCLSDSKKFYFNPELRLEVRNLLNIDEQTRVLIYSGGIINAWHQTTSMFSFFSQLLKYDENSLMLCLTKDTAEIEKLVVDFPEMKSKFRAFYVPNDEVCRYLNASDFGLLFRENTVMNNVASPTKYAEYMLCGLPVLISEGVGDYSDYTVENNTGVLIKESELRDLKKFDFVNFLGKSLDRTYIADIGRRNFSKESIVSYLITELKS